MQDLIISLSFAVMFIPVVFVHELGHAIAATLMGFGIKEFKVISLTPHVSYRIRECWAWQNLVAAAGGPAASILPYFLIGGKWSWVMWIAEANGFFQGVVRFGHLALLMAQELDQPLLLTAGCLLSLLFGVVNLVPSPMAFPFPHPTDGWQILKHGFHTLLGVRYVYQNKADDQK